MNLDSIKAAIPKSITLKLDSANMKALLQQAIAEQERITQASILCEMRRRQPATIRQLTVSRHAHGLHHSARAGWPREHIGSKIYLTKIICDFRVLIISLVGGVNMKAKKLLVIILANFWMVNISIADDLFHQRPENQGYAANGKYGFCIASNPNPKKISYQSEIFKLQDAFSNDVIKDSFISHMKKIDSTINFKQRCDCYVFNNNRLSDSENLKNAAYWHEWRRKNIIYEDYEPIAVSWTPKNSNLAGLKTGVGSTDVKKPKSGSIIINSDVYDREVKLKKESDAARENAVKQEKIDNVRINANLKALEHKEKKDIEEALRKAKERGNKQ